jgi:hypothetical protein
MTAPKECQRLIFLLCAEIDDPSDDDEMVITVGHPMECEEGHRAEFRRPAGRAARPPAPTSATSATSAT